MSTNSLFSVKSQTKSDLKYPKQHSSEIICPGRPGHKVSHTLLGSVTPSYFDDYLKVGNALSEFVTEDLKSKARENLGVELNWGKIKGDITKQKDLLEYLDNNALGTKLDVVSKIPTNDQQLEDLFPKKNQQITIYQVHKDQYIKDNYQSYDKDSAFTMKAGDLLLTAKYENLDINESNPEDIPYIVTNFNNKKVNLVFDWDDFEIGVVDGSVQTTYRQLHPVWEIQEVDVNKFKFKHINSGLYLQANGYKKNCSLTSFGSVFTLQMDADGSCELVTDNGFSLNMNGGSGINNHIIEYDQGSSNKIHIIDVNKYNIPVFSKANSKTYYTIQFELGNGFIGIYNDQVKTVESTEENSALWAFVGNKDKFILLNKQYQNYLHFSSPDSMSELNDIPTIFKLLPVGYSSNNNFEIATESDLRNCLNQFRSYGIGINIAVYTRLDSANLLHFQSRSKDSKIMKIIATNTATKESDGLMSKEDKQNIDKLSQIGWIDVIN